MGSFTSNVGHCGVSMSVFRVLYTRAQGYVKTIMCLGYVYICRALSVCMVTLTGLSITIETTLALCGDMYTLHMGNHAIRVHFG